MPSITITTHTTTYTVTKEIGHGCSGTVLLAYNQEGMPVAIKKAHNVHSDLAYERTILTKIHKPSPLPGIPQLLDSLDQGEETILVMEYIEGTTIYDMRRRSFPTTQVITMVTEFYSILAQVHERGLVHGDLNEGNIIWTKDNHIAIIDLGNATIATPRNHRAYRSEVRDILYMAEYWLCNMAQDPDCPLRKTLAKWTQDTLDESYGPLTLPASAITLLQRWQQVVQQVMTSPATIPLEVAFQ